MVRNPWGYETYNGNFSWNDTRWTNALAAQVPFGIDPRTQEIADGISVVPVADFFGCFADITVGHYRNDAGYYNTWYDVENATSGKAYLFSMTPSTASTDLYWRVDSYPTQVMNISCSAGNNSAGTAIT